MTTDDPYKILGVKRTATDAQIKAAYRRQANANHPDKHAGKSDIERNAYAQQFQRATWAYDILRDPQARAYFDKHGRVRSRVRDNELTPIDRTLVETFRLVVANHRDLRRTDLIKQIRLKLTDDRMAIRAHVGKLSESLEEYRTLVDRFLRAYDPDNVLVDSIRQDIEQITALIESETAKADHLKDCLTELQYWRYLTDDDLRNRAPSGAIAYVS